VRGMVVDTSVWIDFFAGLDSAALEEALSQGGVILPPIVVAELISGAKKQRERAAIEDLLSDLPVHSTPLAHWIRVGELRRHLSAAGVSVSTPDAHVAQCALDLDALLLTRDGIFSQIAGLTRLRLHSG
jgi:tRNA(fMet)-specific endonuclease VapC